jgi:hypothetical protein
VDGAGWVSHVTGLSISDTTLQFKANWSATEFGVLEFRRRGVNEIICISYKYGSGGKD